MVARMARVTTALLLALGVAPAYAATPVGWTLDSNGARVFPPPPQIVPTTQDEATKCPSGASTATCASYSRPADPVAQVPRPVNQATPPIDCTAAGAIGCVRAASSTPARLVADAATSAIQPLSHKKQPASVGGFSTAETSARVWLLDVSNDGHVRCQASKPPFLSAQAAFKPAST